jgi:hypothetical protein
MLLCHVKVFLDFADMVCVDYDVAPIFPIGFAVQGSTAIPLTKDDKLFIVYGIA